MVKSFFITGTYTNVGKTYVTCAIAKSLRDSGIPVGIYKPVCSGAISGPAGPVWEDIEQACRALGENVQRELICPQRFLAPVAPPVAARLEGQTIDEELLLAGYQAWQQQLADTNGVLLIEGAGGWLSPLSDRWTCADFARQLDLPIIIVAAQRLGVINHTLLTIASVRQHGLCPVAVVLNSVTLEPDLSASTNAAEISRLGSIDRIFQIPHGGILPGPFIDKVLT